MNTALTKSRLRIALAAAALINYAAPANAQYDIQIVNPPGSLFTQTFGINNAGMVTGGADDGVDDYSFVYDMKRGTYTVIDYEMSVLEISNSGVMVGDIDTNGNIAGVCAIRDRKGNITEFYPPSFGAGSVCQARGINSSGKVSGFEIDAGGEWLGFVYDPVQGTYEEFLPSGQTFAHAINARGQVAGSEDLDADEAYPGSPPGRYGYVREADGSVKYFAISQSLPGQTRARGISESGRVAGFYRDPDDFMLKGFVTELSKGTDFGEVTLADDQIIHRSPCNPETPAAPGPGYELYTDMAASQVRNDGVVVGSCTDDYFHPGTGDFVGYGYGFIATPVK